MMKKPKIIIILGQTATGKSDLAVQIALRLRSGSSTQKFGGEIISADSRQVYKGLDIGTGKITQKEMKGVPHHLLDIVNPNYRFTVAEYKKLAEEKIKEILARGNTPIICGGTGFYIDSISKGMIFPEVPPNIRLRKNLEKKSLIELLKILKQLDTRRVKNIDIKNKVRLIRAIEIAKTLGKVPRTEANPPPYKFIKIGLYLPGELLKKKVEKRVKKMFNPPTGGGLLNEIKKLKKPVRLGGFGVSEKRLKELGFEYYNPTPEKVISETLKYAKRQMTWFNKDKNIYWINNPKQKIFT